MKMVEGAWNRASSNSTCKPGKCAEHVNSDHAAESTVHTKGTIKSIIQLMELEFASVTLSTHSIGLKHLIPAVLDVFCCIV